MEKTTNTQQPVWILPGLIKKKKKKKKKYNFFKNNPKGISRGSH